MIILPSEKGQGLVEYGLLIILIAIVVVLILTLFGEQISSLFGQMADAFP